MKTTNTRTGGPYDEYYASRYNSIWGESAAWATEGKFHIETITTLLQHAGSWLDAGCGTGFLLSKFPGTRRAGFDLSPAMLNEARKANPGVEFYNQNLLDAKPEWDGKWDLVTCTGQPWSYLPTLEDIEKAVKNLSGYTSMKGSLMLTPIDLSDFIGIHTANFFDEHAIQNEVPVITGIHWSYKELDTVDHNCLSPNLDQWVRWFARYFYKVEIIYWPHEPAFLVIPRRVIICSEKRAEGDNRPANIIEQPFPVSKHDGTKAMLSSLPSKILFAELAHRVFSGRLIYGLGKRIFSKKA
jgi:SAM-dependent methyltransferase